LHFWTREFVNDTLRLARRQSYRVVPATASGRIRSDAVLSLLNRSRIGIEAPLSALPDGILTIEEAADRFGITAKDLRRWTRRIRRAVPHFRINRRIVRFPAALLENWLKENSK